MEVCNFLKAHGVAHHTPEWIMPAEACDIFCDAAIPTEILHKLYSRVREDWQCDIIGQAVATRNKRLLIADMDATMLAEETLDHLAEDLGLADQIIPITKAAMEGAMDFKQALQARVALLEGTSEAALETVWQKTTISKGARALMRAMKLHGVHTVLVSGGFTFFTEKLAATLGFDAHFGNQLEVKNGVLTGRVIPPILDKDSKLQTLQRYCETLHIQPEEVIAIGDGANDIPMLQAAGLGVGYRAKPAVRAVCDAQLNYADLSALLYVVWGKHPL